MYIIYYEKYEYGLKNVNAQTKFWQAELKFEHTNAIQDMNIFKHKSFEWAKNFFSIYVIKFTCF